MYTKPLVKYLIVGLITITTIFTVKSLLQKEVLDSAATIPDTPKINSLQNQEGHNLSVVSPSALVGPEQKFLPQYEILNTKENITKSLLSFLKITAKKSVLNHSQQPSSYWTQEEKTLYLQDGPLYFSYKNSLNQKGGAPVLSKNQAVNLFYSLINKLGLVSNNLSVIVQKTTYLNNDGGEPREISSPKNGDTVRVVGYYEIDQIPVLATESTQTPLIMEFDGLGNLVSASVFPLHITKGSSQIPIINYSQAVNDLSLGKGFLISADVENSYYGLSDISFSKANFKTSQYGFIPSKSYRYLSPIFIFKGRAPQNIKPFKSYAITFIVAGSSI